VCGGGPATVKVGVADTEGEHGRRQLVAARGDRLGDRRRGGGGRVGAPPAGGLDPDVPVPMRVEDSEQDRLNAGRDYAKRQQGQYLFHIDDPERYWGAVEVPYKSYYVYEEILATIGDRPLQDNTLLAATGRVVSYLANQRVVRLGGRLPESERRRLAALYRHAVVTEADRAVVAGLAPTLFMVYDAKPDEQLGAIRSLHRLRRS
jgi:hypothetical protein